MRHRGTAAAAVAFALTTAVLAGNGSAEAGGRSALAPRRTTPISGRVTTDQVNASRTSWSPDSLEPPFHRAWQLDLPGEEISPPLVADGHVFLVHHTYDTNDPVLSCLSVSTGHVVWSRVLPANQLNTLTMSGSSVFVLNSRGQLLAYALAHGHLRWQRNLSTPTVYSFTMQPTAKGGSVYIGAGGIEATIFALDADTGRVRWTARANGVDASPAVDRRRVYLDYAGPQLYAFARPTGVEVWHQGAFPDGGGIGIPTVYRGRVYEAGLTGEVVSARTGALLDTYYSELPIAVHGETLVSVEDGGLHAVDRMTQRNRWRWDAGTGVTVADLAMAGHRVYAVTTANQVISVGLGSGRLGWHRTLPTDVSMYGVTVGSHHLWVWGQSRLVSYAP
jgi:outer membrane protein assembly factor BamB